jgi:CheY-like chemotaxis protein
MEMDDGEEVARPLNILLAEDNPVNQAIASRMLRRLGHTVDIAENGLEALAAMERLSYDVVLMDLQMPEMDGLEATMRIRERWREKPRIIFVTTCAHQREDCLNAGGDGFLSKPMMFEDLKATLSEEMATS